MRTFFFAAFLFCASLVLAQGPELLRQQYGKSPYDYEFYRKWNFDVFIQPHLSNTTNRETKGRFNLDMGGNVHYRFTKSFGLSSGVHYHRLAYNYTLENDSSLDRLLFLRFPLALSVYPVKRIRLSLGISYHWLLDAKGQPPPSTTPISYPEGVFVNSLGLSASAHYTVWKLFSTSLAYRFQKRSINPLQRETQNFNGLALGLHYTLLNPKRKKQ